MRPEERVALQIAAQGVEEAALEISKHGGAVVVIAALHRRQVGAAGLGSALILVLKARQRHQVRRDAVVALVCELVAVRNDLVPLRIVPPKIHQCAPGD